MLCLQVFSEMGDFLVKTAVLLAAYNGIKNLPALLESLEAQTDSDFSVLMQDDGSEDGTQQLLESWRERIPISFSAGFRAGTLALRETSCPFSGKQTRIMRCCAIRMIYGHRIKSEL